MTELNTEKTSRGALLFLMGAFAVSILLKVVNLKVGAPFVTIDDNTTFEGGFMVWFGNAPPQRMYLESWMCGATSIAVYIFKGLMGQASTGLGANLVADAYGDYVAEPAPYVRAYRIFVLALDMITAWMVYRLGRVVLGNRWAGWAAVLGSTLYLLSYNTVWCDVVARPDALVSVFSISGLYFYYRSDFGRRQNYFWLAAIFLGLGAGLKLHACLFVVFIVLDLIRVHRLKEGLKLALPLAVVSVVFFALASGSPLFDPLKYVKLRMLNVKDDQSPWIQWGEQFFVIIKGSGWLVVPLVFWGVWTSLLKRGQDVDEKIRSLIFLAICWIVLFATIRQLRAYWMLPALPLFYLAFLQVLTRWKNALAARALVAVVLGVMLLETVGETRAFHGVEYGGLRDWMLENVQAEEPIYIYGYEAVELPKSEVCLARTREGLQRNMRADVAAGENHVNRHLKNWEEESRLELFDMLAGQPSRGPTFTYYSIFGTPWEDFEGIIALEEMRYIFVQDGFDPVNYGLAPDYLDQHFTSVARLTGPGGGGRGLGYEIFTRKQGP